MIMKVTKRKGDQRKGRSSAGRGVRGERGAFASRELSPRTLRRTATPFACASLCERPSRDLKQPTNLTAALRPSPLVCCLMYIVKMKI